MQSELIGTTKDGHGVYVDRETSHASTHFAHHPKLISAVKEIISTLALDSDTVRIERDVGEEVGDSDCVETNEGDEIVYALRSHRTTFSRFVKNRKPIPTSWVTLDIRKSDQDTYFLYTAYVGRMVPSFPGDNFSSEQSITFWSTHALVWGPQEIIPGSETSECPWK